MMTEHMKRFLSMLVEGLLAPAIRLARIAAVRHEVESLHGWPTMRPTRWKAQCASQAETGQAAARRA